MSSVCILCGASPTTKAHVLASKLRAIFPKEMQSFTRFQAEDRRTHSLIETRRHGRGTADWQPRVLCARCNGEWMSPIEERAAPSLVALARGEAVTLGTEHLHDVAAWALAASIVRAEVVVQAEPFNREFAVQFREHGLEDIPVWMWLVSILPDPPAPDWLRHARSVRRWSELSHDYLRPVDNDATGEGCMFQLRCVSIIVGTGDVAEHVSGPLRLLSPAVSELWPPPAEPVHWPLRGEAPLRTVQGIFSREELVEEGFFDLGDAPGIGVRGLHHQMMVRNASLGEDHAEA